MLTIIDQQVDEESEDGINCFHTGVFWKNNHIEIIIILRNVQGLCGGGELVAWWSSHQC